MEELRITPELNYKIKINDELYYPATLDVEFDGEKPFLKKEDKILTHYFLPNKYKTHLVSKFRSIDANLLENLDFPNIETEIPKIFLSRNLAEVLGLCQHSIDRGLVKSVYEVEGYQKYFEIFKWREEPKDRFSKFKGTSVFPRS